MMTFLMGKVGTPSVHAGGSLRPAPRAGPRPFANDGDGSERGDSDRSKCVRRYYRALVMEKFSGFTERKDYVDCRNRGGRSGLWEEMRSL